MNKTFLVLGILVISCVVAVSGCTSTQPRNNSTVISSNSSANSTSNVVIQNFAFNPTTLRVKAGTTVTWTNLDSSTHRIVSNTRTFQSNDLNNGDSYTFTFNKTGSYAYYCGIYPSMVGTIVVVK